MHIIEGVLMTDANNNRVHIMYLPLLADLSNAHSYSWGSTVLAMLYRELCRTTKPATIDIGGCLILLQSCSIYPGIERSYTVPIYQLMIEQHAGEGPSGTMGIECCDNLVASNISRIHHARWERFTA
ncbi:hypothetical protein J1N35_001256 [Gossypium stocksii]|uniref:Aminotransferase-like plant mobile domain-containing protein n=1 Tax=Gossypium stocksii TaxID=47602 RepID=A0A9D3WJN0_9ROSI|nr:hypothetical protein J1N35_001256 [Gossypium stocksii]